MSGTGYVIGPQIPQGLAVVVEGLAREILRQQPVDIYAFAAHHFEELVKLREKGRLVEIVPQVSTLADETATIRKLTAPCLTRKMAKKQRETTSNCGWSINRTVKVFKKHGFERDDKKKQAEKKIFDDYSEARSARFSKKTIRGRFVRSSSVGDLLGKYIRAEVGENSSSRDRFVSERYEHEKHLKRQKSAGQIERSEEFGGSRLVANSRPKWSESDVEERTRWRRARTGSAESTFGRYRCERGQREIKSATSQRNDLSRIDALESLVVLPSVVAKNCSTKCSANEPLEPDEPADRNNLVLPPISNDSSKLLKKESNLILPSLSNVKDGVNDIVSSKNSWLTQDQNENENENENENQDEDGTTRVSKEIENIGYSNSRKTDFEEVFRDSLNVTPDSIEFSQRSDSLEHLQEEGGENRSNELKEKLIEIETMEKSIENTLIASEEAVTFNNQLEKGFSVELEASSNGEPRENDTISITETKKTINQNEKETVEEKLMKDQFALEDGKNWNTCSNISSGKDINTDTDIDTQTDRSNVSEPIPVPSSLSLSDNSSIKIEPSCYVLTEGSPCEIPESVTTVIMPDISFPNDEIVQVQHNTRDSDLEKTVSPRNLQTEEFEHSEDPFGDRVCPVAFRSSASIDVDFLRGIRNAVDRTAACQDLGNIKEEEEEGEREVLRVKLSDDGTSTIFDDVENRSETIGNKVNDGVTGGNDEKCLDESRPYVPELNLDSLRDVTICSFGTTESKHVKDRWIQERMNEEGNEDISFREGENTLSSFETLPSEEKTTQDEGISSWRNKFLREQIDATDQTDDRCIELRDDSSNIEEEIARELIKNLILETPIDVDNVFEPKDNQKKKKGEGEGEGEEKEKKEEKEEREIKHEDEKNIENLTSTTTTTTTTTEGKSDHENDISGSSAAVFFETADQTATELANVLEDKRDVAEQVPNDSCTRNEAAASTIHCWTGLYSLPQELSEADERQNRGDSLQDREEAKRNWTIESSNSGLWHTGEFHDSLPLPLPDARNIVLNKDFEASNDTQTDPLDIVPESSTPRPTLVYAIDLSTDSRSLESKLSYVGPSFNFLPCLVRVVGPVADDSPNTILAVVPATENTRDPNNDDLVREPLVLDDQQPKPSIVIEEISVDEQNRDNEDNTIPIYPINDQSSVDDDKLSTNSSTCVFTVQLTDSDSIASHQREAEEEKEREREREEEGRGDSK